MEVFMTEDKNLVIVDNREIQNMIYAIRGKQVMVDSDLATLYQVTTKRLNEQVRRNKNRFPSEFMFRLTAEEYEYLGRILRPQVKTMLMVTEALVKCGAREELGFKGILSSILKKLSGRIVGRAGDELVDGIFKYLDPLISEKLKEISSVYKNFFVEPQE